MVMPDAIFLLGITITRTMALSEDSKDLLQALVELWHQTFSYLKSVALAVALDLGIADAIGHHGGAATLSEILPEIGVSPCKLPGLRRLMRFLTVAGIFTVVQPPLETSSDGHDDPVYKLKTASRLVMSTSNGGESTVGCLFPFVTHVVGAFRDSPLSMGLAAWFRHDEPDLSPYTLLHGTTVWDVCRSNDAVNASVNAAMAADSRFMMPIVLKECGQIFHGIDSLVDVAGGVGGATASVAAAFPSLKCTVLDLPHVVANTTPSNMSNVQFVAGDMFDSIPPANAIFIKSVLHDWGDDKCIEILKNCKKAIPSREDGGKVIIIDIVVGSKPSDIKLLETQVMSDLFVMKVGGAVRDELEWKKLFVEAGFRDYNIIPLAVRSIIELYP